ncbi:MAG: hypothetical protein AAB518_00995 [Patescibacteria group bacterium]
MTRNPVQTTCSTCGGKGKVPDYQTQGEYENQTEEFSCSQCKGAGWVNKWSGGIKTCHSCNGAGKEKRQKMTIFGSPKETNCYSCGGRGFHVKWEES